MLLIEFGWFIPKIKRFSHNDNVTIVLTGGIIKITWLNANLTALFMEVIGLGLETIENIANHDIKISIMQQEFQEALNDAHIENDRLVKCIKELQQSVHDLTISNTSKKSKKIK